MRTKIIIGLAIACGLGAFMGVMVVKPQLAQAEAAKADLARTQAELAAIQASLAKDQADLLQARTNLTATQLEVETSKSALAAKTQEADGLARQVVDLNTKTTGLEGELSKAQADKKEAEELGPKIRAMYAKLPALQKERDAVVAENKVLMEEVERQRHHPANALPGFILPESLVAKVLAVDPKYQFVVLNVGLEHGTRVGGEMTINHDGQYVSTIRISRVEKDYCYGNILQDATLKGEAVEGDTALTSKDHNLREPGVRTP